MAFLEFPHNLRNIPRILMAIVILVSAGFVWRERSQKQQLPQVLGTEAEVKIDVQEEIGRIKTVLRARPDYAAAWLRLAVLYEQIGEIELAADARNTAVEINPDLEGN